MLNQSSRAYDQGVDCNYLYGINPSTGAPTLQLLGLYNAGAYSFVCETQTVTSSSGAIVWSALWMKVFFLDPTLNLLFYDNLQRNQGSLWQKIGSIAYPIGLSGGSGAPPPCGFFGMAFTTGDGSVSNLNPAFPYPTPPTSPLAPAHGTFPTAWAPFYACSANNLFNGNETNPLYFVPITSPKASYNIPDGVNLYFPNGINPAMPAA
eukprot:341474-Chlamydomonas_euryale.AAC.1